MGKNERMHFSVAFMVGDMEIRVNSTPMKL